MLRNPLTAGRGRLAALAITVVSFVGLFLVTSGAQAVVVNDQGIIAGIALNPGTTLGAGVSAVTSNPPCTDPWLAADFSLPNSGLCWHSGGSVIHANETFALTWDAPTAVSQHAYWSGTRGYLEGFLSDVAAGSGKLTSPFALTPQYQDGSGRAGNTSIFGGGCIDYGSTGGSACEFGSPTGGGHNYPSNGCTPTTAGGAPQSNTNCLTDAQIQGELATIIAQAGIQGHTQPGYTPLVDLLTPPGVETCLDASGNVCSVNSSATTTFCSYHSQVNVGGTEISYVVQPWTAFTNCDDPSVPQMPSNPTPQQLSMQAGMRMASPLSQGMIAAIVNPALNGWFALDGSEINDNGGCTGLGNGLDTVTVGVSSQNPYYLQREFNNGGAISPDPYTYFGCAPVVVLTPNFVVPSAVNQGDVVALDGSSSATTLLIPNAGYQWNFGDGSTATGPSVEHSYARGGVYTVTLTVTDRGQHQQSLSQTITVLGPTGQPVTGTPGQLGGSGGGGASPLQVRIQLMPQGLKQVLRSGIAVRVTSNENANGIASVSIARSLAKRLHLRVSRRPFVTIGRGTLSSVKHGTVMLYLHLSRTMAARIRRLHRVTLTVGLQLVGPAGDHLSIDAAGRY